MAITKVTSGVLATDAVGVASLSATGTASASTFLRGDNAWASAAAGFNDVEAITATATYTVPSGITKLLVIITGGGGGGAGGSNAIGNTGMGGVAGTTVIARVTVVAADTISVAIGAGGSGGGDSAVGIIGGDSTFTHATGSGSGSMSTITAPGGKPGLYMAATVAPAAGTVGANNEGLSIKGGYGSRGYSHATGIGGSSFWGSGGQGSMNTVQVALAANAYGAGGGAGGNTSAGGYSTGSAGADGVCFIMEYK